MSAICFDGIRFLERMLSLGFRWDCWLVGWFLLGRRPVFCTLPSLTLCLPSANANVYLFVAYFPRVRLLIDRIYVLSLVLLLAWFVRHHCAQLADIPSFDTQYSTVWFGLDGSVGYAWVGMGIE